MSDTSNYQLPVWAPRLRKAQIERLYQSCGRGFLDEELIDDVGFSLYSRCLSMLQVREAMFGNPPCPRCDTPAQIDSEAEPFVICPNCDWRCPWDQYKKTYQHKGLFAGGLTPFVQEFVDKFPATPSHRERMVLIDIMAFLDRLTYGADIPPEIERTRQEWRKKWRENAWANGRGQSG